MGRKAEPGIPYYPMNCNHINHKKIRLLINDCGGAGYWVWQCLLAHAYETKGYFFDCSVKDEVEVLATDVCKVELKEVEKVIECCLRRGLFDKRLYEAFKILTSERMQENYLDATAERRRKGTEIEIREELLLIKIPENSRNISILPRNKEIIPRNNSNLPRQNPQSRVEKSRVEKSKEKNVSAPAAPAPPKVVREKREGDKEVEPYWQLLVDTFFDFYSARFKGEKPSFDGKLTRDFKTIVQRLKKRAADRKKEWNEQNACAALSYFLEHAFKDDWLRRHFTISNLVNQFDTVFQRIVTPPKSTNGQVAGPAVKPLTFDDEVKYFFGRFLEGEFDPAFMSEEFCRKFIMRKDVPDTAVTNSPDLTELQNLQATVISVFQIWSIRKKGVPA